MFSHDQNDPHHPGHFSCPSRHPRHHHRARPGLGTAHRFCFAVLVALVGVFTAQPSLGQNERFKTERWQERTTRRAAMPARRTTAQLDLFAIDDGRNDSSGTLFRVGTTAVGGVVDIQVIGETGVENIWDIAFVGERLYGIVGTFDELWEIDPDNGVAVLVKDFNIPSQPNALIAESPTTLLTVTSALGELWRIDLLTLTASLVGAYGSSYNSSGDLAFDASGRLFGTVERGSQITDILVEVDPATGNAQPIGDLLFQEVYGLAVERTTQTLYGVVDSELAPKLVTIDKLTGAPTVIGTIPVPNGITGFAITPQCLFKDGFETGNTDAWSDQAP